MCDRRDIGQYGNEGEEYDRGREKRETGHIDATEKVKPRFYVDSKLTCCQCARYDPEPW